MSETIRCPRRYCGALARVIIGAFGQTSIECKPCLRNARGVCRDCPSPLPSPRALRCVACAEKHKREQANVNSRRRYADPELRAKKLAQQQEYRQRPEVRARVKAYKRQWIAADPSYATVAMRKYRATPKGRANTRRNNRRWNTRHAEERRAYSQRYYAENRETLRAKQRERYHRSKGRAA